MIRAAEGAGNEGSGRGDETPHTHRRERWRPRGQSEAASRARRDGGTACPAAQAVAPNALAFDASEKPHTPLNPATNREGAKQRRYRG